MRIGQFSTVPSYNSVYFSQLPSSSALSPAQPFVVSPGTRMKAFPLALFVTLFCLFQICYTFLNVRWLKLTSGEVAKTNFIVSFAIPILHCILSQFLIHSCILIACGVLFVLICSRALKDTFIHLDEYKNNFSLQPLFFLDHLSKPKFCRSRPAFLCSSCKALGVWQGIDRRKVAN